MSTNTSEKLIQYFFIGNVETSKKIVEYPNKIPEFSNEISQIFDRICLLKKQTYDLHNKVPGSHGDYFFTVTPNNIFYLLIGNKHFEERVAFVVIEKSDKEKVYTMVNDKGDITSEGKQCLKLIVEPYQNKISNKTGQVQAEIDEVKIEMKKNITKVLDGLEDVRDLEKKATDISFQAEQYKDNALDLKRQTCLRNLKWTIIIVSAVILLVLIIVVPIVVTNTNTQNQLLPNDATNKTKTF